MKTIWKFLLAPARIVSTTMPMGASPLCVQMQDGDLCLWATVDPKAPVEARAFYVFGTGHDLPPDIALSYVGTVQDGALVWHVFEAARRPVGLAGILS